MTPQDPWESRLRDALRRPGEQPPVDVEAFIGDVHRGARGKRRRQYAGVAAAVAVLTGGGVALGVAVNPGDGQGDGSDIADSPMTTTGSSTAPESTSATTSSTTTPPTTSEPPTSRVKVLSLTSTGNDHQWVLVSSHDDACTVQPCTLVYTRSATDGTWTSLGPLPVPASAADRFEQAVQELRVVGDATVGYNAFAFSPGLLSAHRLPTSTAVRGDAFDVVPNPLAGQVFEVEARAATVYALVQDGEAKFDLLESPSANDDFSRVDVGVDVRYASDLVVSAGAVAFVESGGEDGRVVSSPAGDDGATTGPWDISEPCGGGDVEHLSSSANVLWALCRDGSVTTATVDGDALAWSTPVGDFDPASQLSARSATSALVAGPDGISAVTVTGEVTPLSDQDLHTASMLGFTNDTLGFAVVDGQLWRTTDGGETWQDEQVVPAD